MSTAIPPLTCAKCQRPLSSYYKVERIDVSGQTKLSIKCCSLVCLIQWATNFGMGIGTMAVMKIQHQASQVLTALRGPKKP